MIGTDGYISPEECSLGEAGAASDVFALAVTTYEMLTGALPFAPGTPNNPYPQFTDDPAPMRTIRPSLPRELDQLILTCLNRSPNASPALAKLLPRLNALITHGPRMWPDGFQPGNSAAKHKRLAKSVAGQDDRCCDA